MNSSIPLLIDMSMSDLCIASFVARLCWRFIYVIQNIQRRGSGINIALNMHQAAVSAANYWVLDIGFN